MKMQLIKTNNNNKKSKVKFCLICFLIVIWRKFFLVFIFLTSLGNIISDCVLEKVYCHVCFYNLIGKHMNWVISFMIMLCLKEREFYCWLHSGQVMNTLKLLDNSIGLRQILQKHEMSVYNHLPQSEGSAKFCYIWNSFVINHQSYKKTPPIQRKAKYIRKMGRNHQGIFVIGLGKWADYKLIKPLLMCHITK